MRTDFNSTQNFGMAMKIRPEARSALTRRLKTDKEVSALKGFIETQKTNPYSVDLREVGDGTGYLEAFIKDETKRDVYTLINVKESWIGRTFRSPIAFIKKACGIADKLNETNYNPSMRHKVAEALKDVPEN